MGLDKFVNLGALDMRVVFVFVGCIRQNNVHVG